MNEVLTKKKYVAPSVQVLELEATQILAGSDVNAAPSVNRFESAGSLGSGDMEESSPARRTSIWD
ncbi:hypothetical protein KSW92_15955 [Prevotella copri]|uniref:hypothetical protein n=1 Tax=Segatella copri TaxID=165179 RepID=UPI001C3874A0|nr:hypothetical protein [Segatella copri]MBV3430981.1 hypothetical protein [Segatella copri]